MATPQHSLKLSAEESLAFAHKSEERLIEHYARQQGGQWLYTATKGLDSRVEIISVGCCLVLSEVYDRIIFTLRVEPDEPEEEYRDPEKR